MQKILEVKNFSKELVTNVDSPDVEGFRTFRNVRADQLGKARGIRGNVKICDGPNIDTVGWIREFVLNDTQVLLALGTDANGVQHLYYSTDTGTTWIEITEMNYVAADTVTSDTVFTIKTEGSPPTGLDSSVSSDDDYYNNWYVHCDRNGLPYWDMVIDYDQSSSEITTKYGLTNIAQDDILVMVRFPLWGDDDIADLADGTITNFVSRRNFVVNNPYVVQRDDALAIYTGRTKNGNLPDGTFENDYSGIWFGYIETGNMFDDSDLSFTGYYAERKILDMPRNEFSISTSANSDDPVPALSGTDYYVVMLSFIYDGYQESPIFLDQENLDSFTLIFLKSVQPAADKQIDITLSFNMIHLSAREVQLGVAVSRRVTGVRIYMSEGYQYDSGFSFYTTDKPFFFVKEIGITDTTWAGSGPHTFATSIIGREWNLAKQSESELILGYFDFIRVDADFGVKVKGREIAVGCNINQEFNKSHYVIVSPTNAALRNVSDAFPEGNVHQTDDQGIYDIVGAAEVDDRLVILGSNHVSLYELSSQDLLQPVIKFVEKGIKGYAAFVSTGDRLYFSNRYSIYMLEGIQMTEIGYPVRDTWQDTASGIGSNNSEIVGYDPEESLILFYDLDDDIYIYDILRRTWRNMFADSTVYQDLSTGVDGEMFAVLNDDLYELFSSSATQSLSATIEKDFDFDTVVEFKQFWLNYKSTTLIKVYFYNLEKSEDVAIAPPLLFTPKSTEGTVKLRAPFKTQRLRIKIEKQASTDQDFVINSFAMLGTPIQPGSDKD